MDLSKSWECFKKICDFHTKLGELPPVCPCRAGQGYMTNDWASFHVHRFKTHDIPLPYLNEEGDEGVEEVLGVSEVDGAVSSGGGEG